jgi:hypothetical protein
MPRRRCRSEYTMSPKQPALILLAGAPDVLAVRVVQKTVDGLRDGGVVVSG